MNVFKKYADFYDSLYEDKNYQQECNFVKRVFERYAKGEIKSRCGLKNLTHGRLLARYLNPRSEGSLCIIAVYPVSRWKDIKPSPPKIWPKKAN